MQKITPRLLALILTLAVAMSLAACGQDNQDNKPQSQETTEKEVSQGDPIVRLYFQTEEISYNNYEKYEYEEHWWEKDKFTVKVNGIDENGNETVSNFLYTCTENEVKIECDSPDLMYTSVNRYENGRCVYSYTEYYENPNFLSVTTNSEYDQFGRLITTTSEYKNVDSQYDHIDTETYVYTETTTGSVGVQGIVDFDTERHYDENYRFVQQVRYLYGEIGQRTVYEYNSAGCMTSAEVTNNKGEVFWSNVVFDYFEVPLSVAQKYPMFKWEYVD